MIKEKLIRILNDEDVNAKDACRMAMVLLDSVSCCNCRWWRWSPNMHNVGYCFSLDTDNNKTVSDFFCARFAQL
jgi:hypothetical protein